MSPQAAEALCNWCKAASVFCPAAAGPLDHSSVLADARSKVMDPGRQHDVVRWCVSANTADVCILGRSLVRDPECLALLSCARAADARLMAEVEEEAWTMEMQDRISKTEPGDAVRSLYAAVVLLLLAPEAATAMLPLCPALSAAHDVYPPHPNVFVRVVVATFRAAVQPLPRPLTKVVDKLKPRKQHWLAMGSSAMLNYLDDHFMAEVVHKDIDALAQSFTPDENAQARREVERLHRTAVDALADLARVLYSRKVAHQVRLRSSSGTGEAFTRSQ